MKKIIVSADVELSAEMAALVGQVLAPSGSRFINGLKPVSNDQAEPPTAPEEILSQIQVMYTTDLSAERFRQLKQIEWLHCPFAGVNRILGIEAVQHSPVKITNGSGIISNSVADQVMAYVLMFSRQMVRQHEAQQRHEWIFQQMRGQVDELAGQTVGLIGYGRIAAAIARRARGFDMRVIATRNRLEEPASDLDQVLGTGQLDVLLAQADYVVVTAPLTPQTQGMLGAAQFEKMKPTAYLINIARGQLVREGELIEALQAKKLAGAGLDVFETEPLPPASPLWEMPNVIITPHSAGIYKRLVPRSVEFFCRQLTHYLNDEPLENLVSRERGY